MEKPGRNDPCSCGSGKKFKKCCENKGLASRFHLIEDAAKGKMGGSFFQKTFLKPISENDVEENSEKI